MFIATPLPAFSDNYIWALSLPDSSSVVVVDPGDAQVVLDYLKENNLQLSAILVTHHHPDHTGGISKIQQSLSQPISVYGPENSPFSGITNPLKHKDVINLDGVALEVLSTPGHTLDHICYYSEQGDKPQLFCGDTLFLAGCGRLFEGTPSQMLAAMKLLQSLPPSTEVYCTHEYSLANLAFANEVEPSNQQLHKATAKCKALREQNKPTLPSSIAQEIAINPFMRTNSDELRHSVEKFSGATLPEEVELFASLREWKNQF